MEVKKKREVGVREGGTRSDEEKKKQIKIKKKIEKEGGRVRECGTRSKKQKKRGEKRCGK